ncbi:MAG TPA: SCO family protein [Gallionella sp.]|nr:SCO family protein [Gallionella sp.]
MAQTSVTKGTFRNSAPGIPHMLTATVLAVAAFASFPAWPAPVSIYDVPYNFINDSNETVHLSKWRGKPIILTMEYSECRFMCTTTFYKMKAVQAAADKKKMNIDFVVVSLDPKNETPQTWHQYRISSDLDRSNWHLLIGSEANTQHLADLLGIRYWYMDEHILHDFKIVRLNAKGEIVKSIVNYDDEPDSLLQ